MAGNREQPFQSGALPSQTAEGLIDAGDLDRQPPRPHDVVAREPVDPWCLDAAADVFAAINQAVYGGPGPLGKRKG